MNTFGRIFRLTTFGESHGPAMGGIIDGMPSGHKVDFGLVDDMLRRRRPGSDISVSARREEDYPRYLSGLDGDGVTLGTPIGFTIANRDQRPDDYSDIESVYRPNHADYTYDCRYGIRDPRGGGRSSARDTVSWVVGGGFALSYLHTLGIGVEAGLTEAGGAGPNPYAIRERIEEARKAGDSVGGIVEVTVAGLKPGIGNPNFRKLHAVIGGALFGINGVKGVEYGDGFEAARETGSRQADCFIPTPEGIRCATNHSGGIQGGISNGMPLKFRVAFKPTPSIPLPLETVDKEGNKATVCTRGRHDACIAVRGAVVCEAVVSMALLDAILETNAGIFCSDS